MSNLLFILFIGIFSGSYLLWGFKKLPHENKQIMAVLPVKKNEEGMWEGINLTYYGLLCANAVTISSALAIILMGSVRIPLAVSAMIVGMVLLITVPLSSIIAQIVEKKPATFTVGGSAFVGIFLTPLAIWISNESVGNILNAKAEYLPVMAALCICYCFGEGLGRLACISFGCCYGKPLNLSHPVLQKLFSRFHFIFTGKTKKIAYAHGWEGLAIVPIQAITAIFYVLVSVIGLALFVNSCFLSAFLIPMLVAFGWRIASEFFRSDYRGEGKISTYQKMSIAAIISSFIDTLLLPHYSVPQVHIASGLDQLANPGVVILLQLIWIMCIGFLGKSKVTGSVVSFFIHSNKI